MIYISSTSVKKNSIVNCVIELAEVGFRRIELSGGTKFAKNILCKLIDLKKKYSLTYLIHNYFPPPQRDFVLNIASQDKKIRFRSIDYVKKSINFAASLGVDRYTIHAGYSAKLLPPRPGKDTFIVDATSENDQKAAVDLLLDSINKIEYFAKERNMKIGIENLFPISERSAISLLSDSKDILRFLKVVAKKNNIGILLDLAHLYISSNHYGFNRDEFIQNISNNYSKKIIGIHLSGNNGKKDQHYMLNRDDWQLEAVRKFDLTSIPVTIECRNLKQSQILSQYKMIEDKLGGKV